jgi:hypothetical protein
MYDYLKDIVEVRERFLQEPLTRSITLLNDCEIDFPNDYNPIRQASWDSHLNEVDQNSHDENDTHFDERSLDDSTAIKKTSSKKRKAAG